MTSDPVSESVSLACWLGSGHRDGLITMVVDSAQVRPNVHPVVQVTAVISEIFEATTDRYTIVNLYGIYRHSVLDIFILLVKAGICQS